jgi:hypothetical protein
MFSNFEYESIPLKDIQLDVRNPRIVTQRRLSSQDEILAYLYEYEQLDDFIKKIVAEGKNIGAERPYVVKDGVHFVVIEGNTRIAAYKVLTGLLKPPKDYAVPHIAETTRLILLSADCSIAPSRDSLLPIMANAHFGHGDKSKWGYLGSRKAVYDEWKAGKTIPRIAKAFDRSAGEIKELILEYLLYLKALGLRWSKKEKEALLNPAVQFNPPVRFLQTKGHKEKIGISLDSANLKVVFTDGEAPKRFKHLLKRLVISPQPGLGATATYDDVFSDYGSKTKVAASRRSSKKTSASSSGSGATTLKVGALFAYVATINNALIRQLMTEAKDINFKKLPAAATFLLRNIIETILKEIIHKQNANPANRTLDLEGCLNLCASNHVRLSSADKNVLKDFQKHHLGYVNLGAHGNVIPNPDRVAGARDSIDQFVKRHV